MVFFFSVEKKKGYQRRTRAFGRPVRSLIILTRGIGGRIWQTTPHDNPRAARQETPFGDAPWFTNSSTVNQAIPRYPPGSFPWSAEAQRAGPEGGVPEWGSDPRSEVPAFAGDDGISVVPNLMLMPNACVPYPMLNFWWSQIANVVVVDETADTIHLTGRSALNDIRLRQGEPRRKTPSLHDVLHQTGPGGYPVV